MLHKNKIRVMTFNRISNSLRGSIFCGFDVEKYRDIKDLQLTVRQIFLFMEPENLRANAELYLKRIDFIDISDMLLEC